MQQCGFCSMVSGLLRRAMCVGSRRGSSESYYRELGDQDTLKIEDKESDSTSDDSGEINRVSPRERSASGDLRNELSAMKDRSHATGRFLTMHKRRKKRLLTRSLCQEAALLDDLQMGNVQCILEQSVQWRFNAFTLENVSGGRCLPVLCIHLFHVYGLLTHFQLDVAKAWKLFSLIEEGYHSTNPYHNTVHAADVTQAMHCFLQQEKIRNHMEPLEVMASLIAAIAHDVDHPGVNQPFLIATSNHLAALYRNTSVLENHHWRSAMSCLIESGLVDQLAEGRAALERQISSLILATDITRQQEYLSQFKRHLDTNTLDLSQREQRHLVLQIALKCADISNPCRPWEISRKWSLKVCEEFFRQGDYERRLNLPVTALCDRHTTSIPKIQTGFFKFVVAPLIMEWNKFLQNDLSAQMLNNLLYNQSKWEMLVAQEMAEETRTEISDADLVDDDLETCSGTNMSDSSELLLPLRRSSLTPARQHGQRVRDQLRRFSVPLNVFQDSRLRNRDRRAAAHAGSQVGSAASTGSGHSLHSQLSVQGHCPPAAVLSTEKLLPDSSIASITTPRQATRLSCVLSEGGSGSWKLVRQQTFPPLAPPPRFIKTDMGQNITETSIKESIFSNIFKRYIDKTDNDDASENNNVAVTESGHPGEKENLDPLSGRSGARRESAPVGSQLRENLAALHRGSLPADLLRRRKSMPAEGLDFVGAEKKLREVGGALPQLLRRTLSGKEGSGAGVPWAARRGSAPVCAALGGSGRRKPSAMASCQQWLAKASYGVHERARRLPRRSSLPVEVLTGAPPY